MAARKTLATQALIDQARIIHGWLAELGEADFGRPTLLEHWDVRDLTGHLVLILRDFAELLQHPATSRPLPMHELVRRYRHDVDEIAALTLGAAAGLGGPTLVEQFRVATETLEAALAAPTLPPALQTRRGPGTVADFVKTRIIELVVHADDLSRSLPEREPVVFTRPALSSSSRSLTAILAAQNPGQTLEVRVPPYAAVQCGTGEPGPTHTRGTPPNVIETDPVTFLRLATGRLSWQQAVDEARVSASGLRADLSGMVPVLS